MILDTNAVSEMAEGNPELLKVLRRASDLYLPVIVLGEYRYGIARSRAVSLLEAWLEQMENELVVLDITSATSRYYAKIRNDLRIKGKPIPENDLWIAALAKEYRQPLISKDSHFESIDGLDLLKW